MAIFTSLRAQGFQAPVPQGFKIGDASGPLNIIYSCFDLQGRIDLAGDELQGLLKDLRLTEDGDLSGANPFDLDTSRDLFNGEFLQLFPLVLVLQPSQS